jgi:predicted RecA/RadA family phage recombinase
MAFNEVYNKAESLVVVVTGLTVKSGWPVAIGSTTPVLGGVAEIDSYTGTDAAVYATVKFNGVFEFDMSAASPITPLVTLAGQALSVGTPVYITTSGVLTTTSTSNTLFGHAIRAKSAITAVAANQALIRLYGC